MVRWLEAELATVSSLGNAHAGRAMASAIPFMLQKAARPVSRQEHDQRNAAEAVKRFKAKMLWGAINMASRYRLDARPGVIEGSQYFRLLVAWDDKEHCLGALYQVGGKWGTWRTDNALPGAPMYDSAAAALKAGFDLPEPSVIPLLNVVTALAA
jgi:hypothetical protein